MIRLLHFTRQFIVGGFSVCESNGELVASVRRFDRKSYIDSVKENHKLFGNAETGAAIEYVYKYIVETN